MNNGCLTITVELVSTPTVVCDAVPVEVDMSAEYGSEVKEASLTDTVDLDVVLEALTIAANPSSDSIIDLYASIFCPFIVVRSFNYSFNFSFD